MNIIDIITKKREGFTLNYEELSFAFNSYLKDEVTDYQMSSLLMAICIRGMNDNEIFDLTDIFIKSGDTLDLSEIEGPTVDKHSTGGVGDKTTLIVAPIVASCGVNVAKLSGRGLGFTGGTIDKLESIPGFNVNMHDKDFIEQVKSIHLAVSSQTGNLVPLDKKIYALRDVTGTVESIPLIATSIMSKKIASGAKNIILDIKVGCGALIKNKDDALKLATLSKKIGAKYGRNVDTIISYMDIPLGVAVGNSLEILEVIDILRNKENNYLVALSKALASKMIAISKDISVIDAMKEVEESLSSGRAFNKFKEMVICQGGNLDNIEVSNIKKQVLSKVNGHITDMNAFKFGKLSLELGAGRKTKEDTPDYTVGIVFNKKIGDDVKVGDVLCTLYVNKEDYTPNVDITEFYEIKEKIDGENTYVELI